MLLILILAPFEVANHAETDWDSQTNEQQLLGRRLIVVTLSLLINKQTRITFHRTQFHKIMESGIYDQCTVNVLEQYVLRDSYEVVHFLSPGTYHTRGPDHLTRSAKH